MNKIILRGFKSGSFRPRLKLPYWLHASKYEVETSSESIFKPAICVYLGIKKKKNADRP